MAYDKVVDSAFLEAGLTLVGDSIRAKGGTSAKLEFPNGMKAAVEAIDTSEDLDEVLDEQDSIIDQIQAALEGKAGASVDYETCAVTVSSDGNALCYGYTATVVENGKLKAITDFRDIGGNNPVTLPITLNVVCGTAFSLYKYSAQYVPATQYTGNFVNVETGTENRWEYYIAPKNAENCTIHYIRVDPSAPI